MRDCTGGYWLSLPPPGVSKKCQGEVFLCLETCVQFACRTTLLLGLLQTARTCQSSVTTAILGMFCTMATRELTHIGSTLSQLSLDLFPVKASGVEPSAVSCPQCGHSRITVTLLKGGGKRYTCRTCYYEWETE